MMTGYTPDKVSPSGQLEPPNRSDYPCMGAQISRLIPPSVVEQVLKGELTIEKGGRQTEVTMLFSDIRGFTTMSDGRPPQTPPRR